MPVEDLVLYYWGFSLVASLVDEAGSLRLQSWVVHGVIYDLMDSESKAIYKKYIWCSISTSFWGQQKGNSYFIKKFVR